MAAVSKPSSAADAVILAGARTPQGKFLGTLQPLTAPQLGQVAVKAAVERSGINPADVDEVILGQVVGAGSGQAVARQVWIGAGYPDRVGGLMINKACGSSMKAMMLAANAIRAEDGSLYVAGGIESMSNVPYFDRAARTGVRYGHTQLIDGLLHDGLWCSLENWAMGDAAEFIADQFAITRDAMDELSLASHQKAAKASDSGAFKAEIVPVTVPGKRGSMVIEVDEAIRRDTTLATLAALKPAFQPQGRVTAGNAPGLNDGAAAVVISSRVYAEINQLHPVARIVGYAQAAVAPKWLFYAPVKAIPLALARAGWQMSDVDLFEINEAFAAQVLADLVGLARDGYELPREKLNVNGGAIALGHPVGASGARVVITLINALQAHGLKRGVAALCLGGAEAVAMAVELE
jgi:acetyl-CoA C-acetyltransferase